MAFGQDRTEIIRTGIDGDHLPALHFRRVGLDFQQRGFGASHPSTPERFLALEKIAEEIKAKKTAGKDLAPQLQK